MQRLAVPLSLVAPLATAAPPTHEFRLDNGLKIIVREDHRAPVVVSQVWYKVGSTYEHGGITGISHALEHMMFKGTERYPVGEYSRIIAENGGRENAFTGQDYTTYFQQLAREKLEVAFDLEADRMHNLKLAEAEFKKEIQVVMEERRLRTEDQPESLTYERFNATAFMHSPHRIPVIGWMDDLEHMTLADLQHWYTRWYAPNNATLVVVGDVEPDAVYQLAKKYFGPVPTQELAPPKPRAEPEQLGERRLTVRAPAEVPYLLLGYGAPVLTQTGTDAYEPYALAVLANVLDGGDSARLARKLVRGRAIAASASAGYDPLDRTAGLFLLDATPAPDQDLATLEAALRAEVALLRDELIAPEELARVKAQVVASDVFQRDSMFYQAMQIGRLETVGLDWRLGDAYPERIQAVTAEQVREVARRYLVDEHSTVAHLVPLPLDPDQPPRQPVAPGGGHVH